MLTNFLSFFFSRFSHSETHLKLRFRLTPRGLLSTFNTRGGGPRLCARAYLIISRLFLAASVIDL